MRAVRAGMQQPDVLAAQAAMHGVELVTTLGAHIIAVYYPIENELSPVPLAERLRANGITVALPVVAHRGSSMIFRMWDIPHNLQQGPFGTMEPFSSAREVIPDAILVPLLAFDAQGGRLGYGGGYYDKTIAALREHGHEPVRIGFGYAQQQQPRVPMHAHDARLHYVVTHEGVIKMHETHT